LRGIGGGGRRAGANGTLALAKGRGREEIDGSANCFRRAIMAAGMALGRKKKKRGDFEKMVCAAE